MGHKIMSSAINSNDNVIASSFSVSSVYEKDAMNGRADDIITYDSSAGSNKKVSLKDILPTKYQKVVKTTTAETTTSSTVWSDVSSLSITLPTSKTFLIRYYLIMESTDATVGANCSLNIGATHTIVVGAFYNDVNSASSRRTLTGDQTNSQATSAMIAANTPVMFEVVAIIRSGASSGAVVPSFRSETGSSATITLRTYSWGEAIQLD
jgi:hypothetical protein